jgi:hypothetical protein
LSVIHQRGLAEFSPDTGLLVSTEGELVVQHVILVNLDSTSSKTIRYTDCSIEISRVDSRGETESWVIRGLEDLLFGLELGNGANRAKDLFLYDFHVFTDIGENFQLDEVSLVTITLTTSYNGGTSLLAVYNITYDTVILDL